MAGLPTQRPTTAKTLARKAAMAKRDKAEKKAARRGGDGTVVETVEIKVSDNRKRQQSMRCRPGTFEWRYGRNKQGALFHAGNHLAILWERAGMTIASSANFLRGTSSGYATGLGDGRANAIDKLEGFREKLGELPASRLVDYCVAGLTGAEIARKHGTKERDMAPVLHQHLRDCAIHFGMLGPNAKEC
ncbi:hypothetical protein [Aliihoeflea sp. PC F10.4]